MSTPLETWLKRIKANNPSGHPYTFDELQQAIAVIEKLKEALEAIGCNETFHRLGGIFDCDSCKALAIDPEAL